ncbi:Eco57I restriction-modification methylase domain-containing protein, partial [Zwartia sp.]
MPLLDFHYSDAIKDDTAMLAQGGVRELGAIFTRVEVVNFILDIAGYTEDQPLHKKRVLEPSFGAGDFILPIIARLLNAWSMTKSNSNPLEELGNAILAVELHKETYKTTHTAVVMLLTNAGIASEIALGLANKWLVQGDYLLTSLVGDFDFVVGNPPYVRQELIPEALLNEYRRRYSTLYDRADLY